MATSLIPDGTLKEFKFSKKSLADNYGITYSGNSGDTWAVSTTIDTDTVSNSITHTPSVGQIELVSYTAQNQSAIPVSTPKPIEYVDRDLIASNSHSVYAYNGLTYAGTGKVATGSSVESKGVEDAVIPRIDGVIDCNASSNSVEAGKSYYIINSNNFSGFVFTRGMSGYSGGGFTPSYNFTAASVSGYFLGLRKVTPAHNTINLDNASIVASKALVTQTADATQVFTQEVIWDTDTDRDSVVDAIAGTTLLNRDSGNLYRLSGFDNEQFNQQIIVWQINASPASLPASYFDSYEIDYNGDVVYKNSGDIWTQISLYSGNGFGDTNQFDQLTSGTDTDLNGNTIQTKVLLKPSSIRI